MTLCTGQRVYAAGQFQTVETIITRNHHAWCAVLSDGVVYAPSSIASNVVELHPPRDTLPSDVPA